MDEELRKQIGDRVPLVILLEGVPADGALQPLAVLAQPAVVDVNLDGFGKLTTNSFLLSKEQALDLTVRLTEMLGNFDAR